MTRLKRKDGKIVGHLIAYGSKRSNTWIVPDRGSYYQTNPPKTMTWGAVQVFEETGDKYELRPVTKKGGKKHAGGMVYLKPSTVRKLHLV